MTELPWTRRSLLIAGSGAIALAAGLAARPVRASASRSNRSFDELERSVGGRLGVTVLDTGSGETIGHRGDERFGFCSTFKLLLAAVVLCEAEQGRLKLDARVHYSAADMIPYAPVTERHLEQGYMTIGALAEAVQVTSDNVAANLLLGVIGGPGQFTAMLRAAGDDTTRLDRLEPSLNFVPPGELRDTMTPMAMSRTVARFLTTDYLSAASRSTLIDWMVSTRTGMRRLRAGFPAGWRAGDKTGTGISDGMANRYNDVAIVFPPGRPPLVVSAFYESPASSTPASATTRRNRIRSMTMQYMHVNHASHAFATSSRSGQSWPRAVAVDRSPAATNIHRAVEGENHDSAAHPRAGYRAFCRAGNPG